MAKKKLIILILLALTQFLVVLDSAIVNVALPAIQESLGFSDESLQWVLTAYILAFGGFLLLGGRASDLFGRRRVLMIGLIGFTVTSLLIGLSQSPLMFIVLRAIQGIAAAFMSPAAMSVLLATFAEGKERNRALSVWTIVASGGAAAGTLLGGIITQLMGWHWDFFVNVPVGILAAWGIMKYLPAHAKEESDKNLDVPGAVLGTAGTILLVYAISEAPTIGLTSLPVISMIIGAILLLWLFVRHEKRAKHPLMPLSVFKIRNVVGGNIIMVPAFASMLGMFFFLSQYLQDMQKFSPILSGLSFLVFPIILGFTAWNAPKLVDRIGIKKMLVLGTTLSIIGIALLAFLPEKANYVVNLLPSMVILPVGMGLFFLGTILAATSGVPARESGLVSGLINTSQQVGGAAGVAVLSSVAIFAGQTSDDITRQLGGYHAVFTTATGLMIVALLVALFVIRVPKKSVGKANGAAVTAH